MFCRLKRLDKRGEVRKFIKIKMDASLKSSTQMTQRETPKSYNTGLVAQTL